MSYSNQEGVSSSSSSSRSSPLSAQELSTYWQGLNDLTRQSQQVTQQVPTGGYATQWVNGHRQRVPTGTKAQTTTQYTTPGRLAEWAQQGTQPVNYQGMSTQQLQALGGGGATRLLAAQQAYQDLLGQNRADPTLSAFQKTRSNQLATRDLVSQQDAINKESEAAIQQAYQEELLRRYNAQVANAGLTAQDLDTLAQIFYAAKGQKTSSSSSSQSATSGINFSTS